MKYFPCLAAACFLTSCATVIRGTHDKLQVQSDPPGANVALSSGERGVTPVTFVKKRTDNFLVTVSKSGFQPQSVPIVSKFSASGGAAALGNAVAGGVIGAIVDGSSGATKALYPNPVVVNLVPLADGNRVARNASISTVGTAWLKTIHSFERGTPPQKRPTKPGRSTPNQNRSQRHLDSGPTNTARNI